MGWGSAARQPRQPGPGGAKTVLLHEQQPFSLVSAFCTTFQPQSSWLPISYAVVQKRCTSRSADTTPCVTPLAFSARVYTLLSTVCPRGTYEPADNATRCSRCEANNYCPGGDKVESPASRGTRVTCGANLVTRNTGARTQTDCGELVNHSSHTVYIAAAYKQTADSATPAAAEGICVHSTVLTASLLSLCVCVLTIVSCSCTRWLCPDVSRNSNTL